MNSALGEQPRRRRAGMERRAAPASLLIVGLLLGLGGGLIYAWLINPVIYSNASPARFSPEFKAEYLFLVSQSLAADGNWERARERLAALQEPDLPAFVGQQLDAYLRQGRSAAEVQNLAALAARLGVTGQAVAFFGPTPLPATPTAAAGIIVPTLTPTLLPTITPTSSPSATPPPTMTATPSPVPSPTPQPTFRLLSQERLCRFDEAVPLIEIVALDAFLDPLAGVEARISWEEGSDHLFTGFKGDLGPGYGDFTMSPDISYSVTLAEGSPTVSGLRLEACESRLGGLIGGWRLTFQKLTLESEEEG